VIGFEGKRRFLGMGYSDKSFLQSSFLVMNNNKGKRCLEVAPHACSLYWN